MLRSTRRRHASIALDATLQPLAEENPDVDLPITFKGAPLSDSSSSSVNVELEQVDINVNGRKSTVSFQGNALHASPSLQSSSASSFAPVPDEASLLSRNTELTLNDSEATIRSSSNVQRQASVRGSTIDPVSLSAVEQSTPPSAASSSSLPPMHAGMRRHKSVLMSRLNMVDINFNLRVYLKELFYHMCFPLSLPFCYAFEGYHYCYNHDFLTLRHTVLTVLIFGSLLTADVLVAIGWVTPKLHPTWVELLMANALFVFHRCMISTKYAFMSPDVLDLLHRFKFSRDQLSNLELMSGWNKLSCEKINSELTNAGRRLGFDLNQVHFHVDSTEEELRAYLNPNNDAKCSIDMERSNVDAKLVKISIKNILLKLALHVYGEEGYTFPFHQNVLFGIALGLSPMFVRVSSGYSAAGDTAFTKLCTAAFVFNASFFYFVICSFMVVGISDYYRGAKMMAVLQMLIESGSLPPHLKFSWLYESVPNDLPYVDLSVSDNIFAWLVARQVMQNFGLEFRKRISHYVSYAFLFAIVLIVVLLGQSLFVPTDIVVDPETKTTKIIDLAVVAYCFAVFALYLAMMVYFGSRGNDTFLYHRGSLFRTQMTIRERSSVLLEDMEFEQFYSQSGFETVDLPPAPPKSGSSSISETHVSDASIPSAAAKAPHQSMPVSYPMEVLKLKECDSLIECLIRLLEVEEETNPITIVGFRASLQLLSTFLTAAGSALTVGIQQISLNRK